MTKSKNTLREKKMMDSVYLEGYLDGRKELKKEILRGMPKYKSYDTEWDYPAQQDAIPRDIIKAKVHNQILRKVRAYLERLMK